MTRLPLTSNRYQAALGFVLAWAIAGLGTDNAHAQVDRVYINGSTIVQSGKISAVTKDGLTLTTGSLEKDYTTDEIRKVSFQSEPRELTRGRESALDGQYEQALDELKGLAASSVKRDLMKADVAYYLVLAKSKLALAGQGDPQVAGGEAIAFAKTHGDSFHFFSVAKLLGDLALATQSYDGAIQYYSYLARAKSKESKMQSRYLTGVALLEKGEIADAEKAFSDVNGFSVSSPNAARLKLLARAGQAVALAKNGKGAEGVAVVNKLISQLNSADMEMSAQIYNAQGACLEATGDTEGALLAYLRTHLLFSGQPDAHAKSLVRLVELWSKVGQAQRAAEARQELQQRYPGFVK